MCKLPALHLVLAAIALCLIQHSSATAAAASASRELTEADVDVETLERVRNDPEAALSLFRDHVRTVTFGEQKRSAWKFMRIRRRIAGAANSPRFDVLSDLAVNAPDYFGHPIVIHGILDAGQPGVAVEPGGDSGGSSCQGTFREPETGRPLAFVDFAVSEGGILETAGLARVCGFYVREVELQHNGMNISLPMLVARKPEPLGDMLSAEVLAPVVHESRGIRPEEADAYYEVLAQARLVSQPFQQAAADDFRRQRIDAYLNDALNRMRMVEAWRMTSPDDTAQYERKRREVELLLQGRARRQAEFRESAEAFPTFVDLFQNTDTYHGRLVTLSGRVRKVTSYEPEEDFFDLGTLHELWLFTEHSQRNPVIVVCSSLPEDFPRDAEVVDGVSVTGYFFKKYRYVGQDAHRLAPLVLAGRAEWTHVEASVIGIPLWLSAAGIALLLSSVGLLGYYLWHSHHEDHEFRERLLTRMQRPNGTTAVGSDPSTSHGGTGILPEPEGQPAERGLELVAVDDGEAEWIAREHLLDQFIRSIILIRRGPDTADTEFVFAPAVVVLKSGLRFELLASALGPADPAISTDRLTRLRDDAERLLGQRIVRCAVDEKGDLIVICSNGRYLSRRTLCLADGSVAAPRLSTLLDEAPDLQFVDYWSEELISRDDLLRGTVESPAVTATGRRQGRDDATGGSRT